MNMRGAPQHMHSPNINLPPGEIGYNAAAQNVGQAGNMNLEEIQANLQTLVFMTANLNAQLHARLASQGEDPTVPCVPCFTQKPLVTTPVQTPTNQQGPSYGYSVQPPTTPGIFEYDPAENARLKRVQKWRVKRSKRLNQKRQREEVKGAQKLESSNGSKLHFLPGKVQKTTERGKDTHETLFS